MLKVELDAGCSYLCIGSLRSLKTKLPSVKDGIWGVERHFLFMLNLKPALQPLPNYCKVVHFFNVTMQNS